VKMTDPFNPKLKWKLGFQGSNGKFLTQDIVGTKIHCTGDNMKKKQIFTVDPFGEYVHLVTPNGKYLSAGQKGELEASLTEAGKNEQWSIEALDDGRWAFKSSYGYYLGAKSEQEVHAFGRSYEADSEKWTIWFAEHPQVVIRHNARSAYVHLEGTTLNANDPIPWGVEALVTIGNQNGRYSLQSSNGKYLTSNGELSDTVTEEAKFILVIKDDQVAFKTKNGKYLQASGSNGKVHAKQNEITKNELFSLEDSHPQVTLQNSGKYVTWKQGHDVKAIHEEKITDKEIFQMEIHRGDGLANARWSFRNEKGAYLIIKDGSFFTGEKQERTEAAWFNVEWRGAAIALKANNGKYLIRKPNGAITASSDTVDDSALFTFNLINRPQLVLRSEFGYVGVRTVQGKPLVQSNLPLGDVFISTVDNGNYAFQAGGKFFKLESDGSISATGSAPEWFNIELLAHSRYALKAVATGKYVKAEQVGSFKANSNSPSTDAELFTY